MKKDKLPLDDLKEESSDNISRGMKETCCGGPPSQNETACCKLDEEFKSEGRKGCGCREKTEAKKFCC